TAELCYAVQDIRRPAGEDSAMYAGGHPPDVWEGFMMNKKTAAWRAFCLLEAWVLVPATLRAQIATADIVGRVTDSSAAVLVGVNIHVENVATGAVRSTQTDSTGNYVVTLLPIGRYSIRA